MRHAYFSVSYNISWVVTLTQNQKAFQVPCAGCDMAGSCLPNLPLSSFCFVLLPLANGMHHAPVHMQLESGEWNILFIYLFIILFFAKLAQWPGNDNDTYLGIDPWVGIVGSRCAIYSIHSVISKDQSFLPQNLSNENMSSSK